MPSDIVLFGLYFLGIGGDCEKPLFIRVSGEEAIWQRKIPSREEALFGKSVVFGAKSHHKYINFWKTNLFKKCLLPE